MRLRDFHQFLPKSLTFSFATIPIMSYFHFRMDLMTMNLKKIGLNKMKLKKMKPNKMKLNKMNIKKIAFTINVHRIQTAENGPNFGRIMETSLFGKDG